MLKFLLTIIILFMVLFILMPYIFQRNFIYFPITEKPVPIEYSVEDMKIITITTEDNLNLESWYKPAENNKPTVVYLHGNGGHLGYRAQFARYFLNEGMGVLLLEYRGYGGNPGKPSEKGLYKDAKAAIKFLNVQNIPNEQIILFGESLGVGVATYLASQTNFCAIILQSPYTNLQALARYHYPLIFAVMRDTYDSQSRIQQIKSPILMTHGLNDIVIPYKIGKQLFDKANEPKQWLEFPYKGHNNLWDDEYAEKIINFIKNDTQCGINLRKNLNSESNNPPEL